MQKLQNLLKENHGLQEKYFDDGSMRRVLFQSDFLRVLSIDHWDKISINNSQLFELGEELEYVKIYTNNGE